MTNYIDIEQIEQAAEQAAAKVADAKAMLRQRQDELDAAELNLGDLRDDLRSGDDSITAQRLSNAYTNVERHQLLLEAAESASKVRPRAGAFVPSLAVLAAEALDGGLPIAAHSVEKAPQRPMDEHALPVAYLSQSAPGQRDLEGYTSGAVTLTIFRSPLHMRLDDDQVQEALNAGKRLHGEVLGGVTREGQDIVADSYQVSVKRGWVENLPIVDMAAGTWRWNGFPTLGLSEALWSNTYQKPMGIVRVDDKAISTPSKSGERQSATVTATYSVFVPQAFAKAVSIDWVQEHLTTRLEDAEGVYQPGLGRIGKVRWSVQPSEHRGRVIKAEAVVEAATR